jgi:hypothetical protein
MLFTIPAGVSEVKMAFLDTPVRSASGAASLGAVLVILVLTVSELLRPYLRILRRDDPKDVPKAWSYLA